MAHSMTRRTLREHCFKLLFCTDFYPPEEAEEQIEDYFRSEKEEETDESGSTEVLHLVELSPEELGDRYRIQLDYYVRALEAIEDLPVKERMLWSFALGREIKA